MKYAARGVVWLAIAIGVPVATGALIPALIATGSLFAVALYLWLRLPRTAHAAFAAGRFARAARRYRVLRWLALGSRRERAAALSLVGCAIARGARAEADALLARLDPGAFDTAERAVWLNNRACALLAEGAEHAAALSLIEQASELRPDVPALQHTRGMALLAVGRVDDAIAVLDGMRGAGELAPRLESERCRDLARAWSLKGETAYAEDYRQRSEALAR